MKKILSVAVVVMVVLTVSALPGRGVTITPPAVLDDALLTVTISDAHGFLDNLGTAAAKVSPMMNATTLKSLLGMQVGDPMLAGLPAGKGLAIVAMDPQTVFTVIEIPAAQVGLYSNKLTTTGMMCRYADGRLIVAKTAAALNAGARAAAQVSNTLLSQRTSTIRIGMKPADYIVANEAMVTGMIEMMKSTTTQAMMQQALAQGQSAAAPSATTTILESEMHILLSLLKQVDAVEITLAAQDGAIQATKVIAPTPGSPLADLLDAPATTQWNPRVQVDGNAAFLIDMLVQNPKAFSAFVTHEAEKLFNNMAIEPENKQAIMAYIEKTMTLCSGSTSESLFGDGSGMSMVFVTEVTDEKMALTYLRNMQTDLKTIGFFDLYESNGMPMNMTFKEKVRQYEGVDIHHLQTTWDLANMPAAQRQQMEAMNMSDMTCEIAVTDGVMIYAMADNQINAIIDRIKSGGTGPSPLAARQMLPAGGFYYCDVDVGRYMDFITSIMPTTPATPLPFDSVVAAMRGAAPIMSAGYADSGLAQFTMTIPADLLGRIGQAAMAMQMQKMQQQMGAPAGQQ